MSHFDNDEIYKFLSRIRKNGSMTNHQMTTEEFEMAEELVSKKLLTKLPTKTSIIYTYGMSGFEKASEDNNKCDGGDKCK